MSDQENNKEIAQLEQVNAELKHSLERCRFLLADCRNKLAANSNDDEGAQRDQQSERG